MWPTRREWLFGGGSAMMYPMTLDAIRRPLACVVAALALTSLATFGCGGEAIPPLPVLPGFDSGDGLDAGQLDAGVYMRPDSGPRLPGADDEITLPFLGPTQTLEIEIKASIRALDVHFSIDTTASFGEEILELQDDLSDEVVPELRRRVDDVSVGVSSFEDFPHPPWGGEDDDPFELQTAITSELRRVDNALANLNRPIGNGGDGPESGAEALYQIATGEGYTLDEDEDEWIIQPYRRRSLPGGGTLGGVGFRRGALHAVVHITDAVSHSPDEYQFIYPGTRSFNDATDALNELGIRVLGIISHPVARNEMESVAIATGAVAQPDDEGCATGIDGEHREPTRGVCPLVFDVHGDGRGLSDTLTDAIVALVGGVEIQRAYTEIDNDPLRFITTIEALEADVENGTLPPSRRDERPVDGVADTFVDVRAGTTLRFAVHLRNELLAHDDAPQFYDVRINLMGDGVSLGTHRIRVQVPARAAMFPTDAGTDTGVQDDASGM